MPARAKPKLRAELRKLGVTFRSLFPDLDGVAADIVAGLPSFAPGGPPRVNGQMFSEQALP